MRQTSLRELRRAVGRGRRQRDRLQALLGPAAGWRQSAIAAKLTTASAAFERLAQIVAEPEPANDLAGLRDQLCGTLEQLRLAGLELSSQLGGEDSAAVSRERVNCFQATQELQSISLRLRADGPLRVLRLLEPQLTNAAAVQVLWYYASRPRRAWQAANELVYFAPLWFWFVCLLSGLLLAHGIHFLFARQQDSALLGLLQLNHAQQQQAPVESAEQLAAKFAQQGLRFLHQQRAPDAYVLAQQALAIKADYVPARCLTAMALVEMGRYQEGAAAYRALLKDNPADATALNNLADLLATHPDPALRNGSEALQLATTACVLTGQKNPTFLATLAEAQAELGRLPEAIATAQQARELARQLGQTDLAQTIETRLRWFETGQPMRQPLR